MIPFLGASPVDVQLSGSFAYAQLLSAFQLTSCRVRIYYDAWYLVREAWLIVPKWLHMTGKSSTRSALRYG